MAFKVLILAATLAFARAGNLISQPAAVAYSSAPAVSSSYFHQASAPVAVAHTGPVAYAAHSAPIVAAHSAPVVAHAVHAPSVGYSEQNVARSLGGAQSVSTYSKAVDSAFSSVRKYDTRITNDGLSLSPAVYAKSYAAPVATYAHSAPVAYSQPILAKSYAAPAHLAYSAPSVVTKTYTAAAPVAYAQPAHYAYSQPAQFAYSHQPAPLIAKHVAPVTTYAANGPVVTKSAVHYSPAAVVAHTNFEGYGIAYHY